MTLSNILFNLNVFCSLTFYSVDVLIISENDDFSFRPFRFCLHSPVLFVKCLTLNQDDEETATFMCIVFDNVQKKQGKKAYIKMLKKRK